MNIWDQPSSFHRTDYDHQAYLQSFEAQPSQRQRAEEVVDAWYPLDKLRHNLAQKLPVSTSETVLSVAGEDTDSRVHLSIVRPAARGWLDGIAPDSVWLHISGHVIDGKRVYFGLAPDTDRIQRLLEDQQHSIKVNTLSEKDSRSVAHRLNQIIARLA